MATKRIRTSGKARQGYSHVHFSDLIKLGEQVYKFQITQKIEKKPGQGATASTAYAGNTKMYGNLSGDKQIGSEISGRLKEMPKKAPIK